jgi:hypothetical protein
MIEPKLTRYAAPRKPPLFAPLFLALFLPLLFLFVIPAGNLLFALAFVFLPVIPGGNLLLELPYYPAPKARRYPSPGHRPGS